MLYWLTLFIFLVILAPLVALVATWGTFVAIDVLYRALSGGPRENAAIPFRVATWHFLGIRYLGAWDALWRDFQIGKRGFVQLVSRKHLIRAVLPVVLLLGCIFLPARVDSWRSYAIGLAFGVLLHVEQGGIRLASEEIERRTIVQSDNSLQLTPLWFVATGAAILLLLAKIPFKAVLYGILQIDGAATVKR